MARMDKDLWKMLWPLNIPQKVRNFTRRACSNILTTRTNLQKWKVKVEANCALCCQQEETGSHILWECPSLVMYGLWFKRKFQKYKTNVQDFFVLARHIYGGKTLYHGVGDLASDSFGYMEC